jgi:hypothetical protein
MFNNANKENVRSDSHTIVSKLFYSQCLCEYPLNMIALNLKKNDFHNR